jgi:ribosomal protein S27AE
MRDNKGKFVKGTNEWKGRKHSEASKEKMRLFRKQRPTRHCEKCGVFLSDKKVHICNPINPMFGRKRPELRGNKLNWKGGRTKRVQLIRLMPEYYQWRSDIFKRDNWTCQTCGLRGGKLEAHHIKELIKIYIENNIKTCEDAKRFLKYLTII